MLKISLIVLFLEGGAGESPEVGVVRDGFINLVDLICISIEWN